MKNVNYLEILSPPPLKQSQDEKLISDWCIVTLECGKEIEAYWHLHNGWITRGGKFGCFIYGYIPLSGNVISWRPASAN